MAEIENDAVSAAEGETRYDYWRSGLILAACDGQLADTLPLIQCNALIDIAESLSALVAVERRRFGQCL